MEISHVVRDNNSVVGCNYRRGGVRVSSKMDRVATTADMWPDLFQGQSKTKGFLTSSAALAA